MNCHETLLARKKRQASMRAKNNHYSVSMGLSASSPGGSRQYYYEQPPPLRRQPPSFKDKSLPSLPPKDDLDHASPPQPLPSRPSKPPYDPSISRGVVSTPRNSMIGGSGGPPGTVSRSVSFTNEPKSPRTSHDLSAYAPALSVSQSSPAYSSSNNSYSNTSSTLTETRNAPPSISRTNTTGSRSSRISVDSSTASDYFDNRPSSSSKIVKKPVSSSNEETSRPLSSLSRAAVYLDFPSLSTDFDDHFSSLDGKTSDTLAPGSGARATSPRPHLTSSSSDDIDENSSSPHTPLRHPHISSLDSKNADSSFLGKTTSDFIPQIPLRVFPQEDQTSYFPTVKSDKDHLSYDGGQATTPPFSLDSYLFDDCISEPSMHSATRELVEAQKRIAELEQQLREKDEKLKPDVKRLESNIMEKRKTMAGLEAKNEVAKKELRMLEEARSRKGSIKDSSTDLVTEFTNEVSQVKTSLQAEIEALVIERDRLKEENTSLTNTRDRTIEDIGMLNLKHNQLLDLHHELVRQTAEKAAQHDTYKKQQSSENLVGHHDSMPPISDEPLVTVLDNAGGDKNGHIKHARRFWKRPIAKGVKGFNKVFDKDAISSGPYVDGEVTNVQHVATFSNGGASTSFASAKEVHTTKPKVRNGWFKAAETSGPTPSLSTNTAAGATVKPDSLLMGYPIEKRIQLENTPIPLIVTRCIQEVEERGMTDEGIYRKSGASSQTQSIEEAFEKTYDQSFDFSEILSGDIAGVTSALKQYLRHLPYSLVHLDQYDNFVQAASHDQKEVAIEKLRAVVNSLPPAYKDCLNYVVSHLSRVMSKSEVNLMTPRNLAVCFAPTLVRHTEGEREIKDMQPRNDGTQMMIEYYDEIFKDFFV